MRLGKFVVLTAVATLVAMWPTDATAQNDKKLEASSKQKDALVTDRPDFTESSSTPPPGRLQLEAGVSYTHRDAAPDDTDMLSAPNMLLRYGVVDAAELRLGVPDIKLDGLGDDEQDTSFGSVALGAKFATALSKKVRVGLLPMVDIGVENGDVGGQLRATASFTITKRLSLSANAGARTFEDQQEDRHWQSLASASAGYKLTNDLSAYLEGYVISPEDDAQVFADTGLLYLVTHWVQLDAYVGAQLMEADTIFGGAGVSVLF